jgi:hypothetical protein
MTTTQPRPETSETIEQNIRRAQAALGVVGEAEAVETMVASGVEPESAFLAVTAARILNGEEWAVS